MKKIYYLFLILFIIFLPSKAYAESYSLSLSCPDVVKPSQNINCSVSLDNVDFTITKINGTYSYSGGLTSTETSLNLNDIAISSPTTLSSFYVTIPSNATSNETYTISLNNIIANDLISISNISKVIRVVSNDTSLSEVSATGGTLTYDASTSTFSAIINEIKTTISASTTDSKARITEGTGEKNLNYGKNEFNLTVLSESGLSKTYKIDITRPDTRSSNNNLSSLIVTTTNIEFNKTKTEYNLSTTSSDVTISATKEDTKSTLAGDIGKKYLGYGLNKFSVKVIAENGNIKTYNINITRIDTRSDNNYLKNITLSSGNIKFNKTTTTYNIDVDKMQEKIKINATLDHSKSRFVSGFGPKEVNLTPGNNTVYLKIENEKGDVRTYTLNINRENGKDSDSSLKEITLSEGNIEFDKDKYEYNINVEYGISKIKIYATPTSAKSKVKVDGPEKLKVGKNKFTITVTAENEAKSEYIIIINRKKQGYVLSSNNYIKNITIKGYKLSFNKKKYDYTLTVKEDKLNIKVVLDDKKATYKIIGNDNLKNNSQIVIKVMSESGEARLYNINIKKQTNLIIILLIIITTLLAGTLIYFIVLRIKRRNKLNNMYKTKVDVIDEDFLDF